MKRYTGILKPGISANDVRVTPSPDRGGWVLVDGEPLPHWVRHSLSGFSWGSVGPEAADLALSILSDCFGIETAERYYWAFAGDVIAKLEPEWELTLGDIQEWLTAKTGNPLVEVVA
jgi:hypothetical protein